MHVNEFSRFYNTVVKIAQEMPDRMQKELLKRAQLWPTDRKWTSFRLFLLEQFGIDFLNRVDDFLDDDFEIIQIESEED